MEVPKPARRLPVWMKMQRADGNSYLKVKKIVQQNHLHTICSSGNCPNIAECWNSGQATFMILGAICTRACKFCNVPTGRPLPPDMDEPARIAESVRLLGLKHCVITSVDRDDLKDGGASFWALTIRMVRQVNPGTTIETLIPDFDAKTGSLDLVIAENPGIISHNLETVRRLTPLVRSRARYDRSLEVLRYISSAGTTGKSGIMLGLGETRDEVIQTMRDILTTGCSILTLGQYLQPSPAHMEVKEYIQPGVFDELRETGLKMGFRFVESSPLVRSSYHSDIHIKKI